MEKIGKLPENMVKADIQRLFWSKINELISVHNEQYEAKKEKNECCKFCKHYGLNPNCRCHKTDIPAFNPSEEELLRIAREKDCVRRIQCIVADYLVRSMNSPGDQNTMAMEIFKDVERAIKGNV